VSEEEFEGMSDRIARHFERVRSLLEAERDADQGKETG
jgi:hypothetical protein